MYLVDILTKQYLDTHPSAKIPITTKLVEYHIKELEEMCSFKKRGAPFKPSRDIEALGFSAFFEKENPQERSILPKKLQPNSKRVIYETLKYAGIIKDDVESTWQGKNRNKYISSYIDSIHKMALSRYK